MRTRLGKSLLCLCVALLPACESAAPTAPLSPKELNEAMLGANRTAWEASGPSVYRFDLEQGNAWFSFAYRLTVVGTEITSAVDLTTGETLDAEQRAALPVIEDLFAQMEEALAGDNDWIGAAFDPALRFPLLMFVDPQSGMVDEEFFFKVSEFHAIH